MPEIQPPARESSSPLHPALMCAHFASADEAVQAMRLAAQRRPFGCELVGRPLLERVKSAPEQSTNGFLVQGDPEAMLLVEYRHADRAYLAGEMVALAADFCTAGLGYAFPVIWGEDCVRVCALHQAGQVLLATPSQAASLG